MRGIHLLAACLVGTGQGAGLFSEQERQAIFDYWAAPERYAITVPDDAKTKGLWQVRLTVEGSQWLWKYNKARGLAKTSPEVDPGAQSSDQTSWERWIDSKVAHDRWIAAIVASGANQVAGEVGKDPGPEPPRCSLEPAGLVQLVGSPPVFAKAMSPMRYSVQFDDGKQFGYVDNVAMRPRYAYFRFAQGVMAGGEPVKSIPPDRLAQCFKSAGIGDSEARVMKAVSLLEGGFDSVNTYDTGYLSVGFIQFATGSAGSGSLGQFLLREKQDSPHEFDADFRKFGIDVTSTGALDVVDPATGAEVSGADAVLKVVADKRLTAVFQRAGQLSDACRCAQLKSAKEQYYPGDDPINVEWEGQTLAGKVSDVFKSEAGLATLMDRKVNTGHLEPLSSVLTAVAQTHEVKSISDLARYEREIVQKMKYRRDYLADTTLSQPGEGSSTRARN